VTFIIKKQQFRHTFYAVVELRKK